MTTNNATKILIGNDLVNVYDFGYDTNGNRKWVVWFGSLYSMIADQIGNPEYAPLKRTDAEYRHVLNALYRIGGKKFNNRKFGGGVVITGSNISTLGNDIWTSINVYARSYNAENVAPQILEQIARRMRCRLPIVVKSTNRGMTVRGEWSNGCELKINVDYDHNVTSTDNYTHAALLWLNKASFKRWQRDGYDNTFKLLDDYTALDANTRVFMYQIEGY